MWIALALLLVAQPEPGLPESSAPDRPGSSAPDRPESSAPDRPESAGLVVHDWSLWIVGPQAEGANSRNYYGNAFPPVVGTIRQPSGVRSPYRMVTPMSLVTFHGPPSADVDVDLSIQDGRFLASWPPGAAKSKRLQWARTQFVTEPADPRRLAFAPAGHWFRDAREQLGGLYLESRSRIERFLAYDVEVSLPVPVQVKGGLESYQLRNICRWTLYDVMLIRQEDSGTSVGWLVELPTAAPHPPAPAEPKRLDPGDPPTPEEVFEPEQQGEGDSSDASGPGATSRSLGAAQPAEAVEEVPVNVPPRVRIRIPPFGIGLPGPIIRAAPAAAGAAKPNELDLSDATRQRVEVQLNRRYSANFDQTTLRDIMSYFTELVQLPIQFDEKAMEAIGRRPSDPITFNLTREKPIRESIEAILEPLGLRYRVEEPGVLVIVPIHNPLEVEPGPEQVVTMAPAIPRDTDDWEAAIPGRIAGRMQELGFDSAEAGLLVDRVRPVLRESHELIVVCRLDSTAVEHFLPLDVFPEPRQTIRSAWLIVHGVDPRIEDEIREWIAALGAEEYTEREAAESRLEALGTIAVPALTRALADPDLERVLRVERLLLKQKRSIDRK